MKKIRKSSELLWLLGIVFVALGVALCSKANLGVSMIAAPPFVLQELLIKYSPFFSVGVVEYLVQGLLLIILCLVIRKFNWRFLLAFLVAVIYGYTLDLFLFLLKDISFTKIWTRWTMLIVGDIITSFGVAAFFRTYMPLQVYELFVAKISKNFSFNITKVKWFFDISLLTLSVLLAFILFGDGKSFSWNTIYYNSFHNIGLGTLFTTIINSPLISLMGKVIDGLFDSTSAFPKLEKALSL